jgi:hypothetical protein
MTFNKNRPKSEVLRLLQSPADVVVKERIPVNWDQLISRKIGGECTVK